MTEVTSMYSSVVAGTSDTHPSRIIVLDGIIKFHRGQKEEMNRRGVKVKGQRFDVVRDSKY